MLVESNNIVSADAFRRDMDRYIELARAGNGPIAVTDKAQVVGFYVSAEEYEAMFGAAVRELLEERASGPKVSHRAVKEHIAKVIERARR